jgi:biotin-dependent carboxylase-like uncharacterized protein
VIEILEPGPLTSVQDAVGRRDWRHLGVPVGGAADAWSARLANRLVGNPEGAALLEITLGGLVLAVDRPTRLALTGGLDATALRTNEARSIGSGATVRIDPGDGARGYLAVAGGIVIDLLLGSASTDLRTGFGGHEGRALRTGDRLEAGMPSGNAGRWIGERDSGPIRIVPGPHAAGFERLLAEWTVAVEADRTGVRLDGQVLDPAGEVPSMGLPPGAIQVPPDGRPIVMLADRPVTGGYPVPACVIRADVGRVAQLRTGDRLAFTSVSVDEARDANRRAEEQLAAIEAPEEDGLGWIGSHG